jgi:hypothetical protein
MNSILLSKSDLSTPAALRRCKTLSLHSGIVALAVVILTSVGISFSGNAPKRTVPAHTLREAPVAHERQEGIPISAEGLLTILNGNNFTNSCLSSIRLSRKEVRLAFAI